MIHIYVLFNFFPLISQETTWTRQVITFCLACDCWEGLGYFQMQMQYTNVKPDETFNVIFVPFMFSYRKWRFVRSTNTLSGKEVMKLKDKDLSRKQTRGRFWQIKFYTLWVLIEITSFIIKSIELNSIHNSIKFSSKEQLK